MSKYQWSTGKNQISSSSATPDKLRKRSGIFKDYTIKEAKSHLSGYNRWLEQQLSTSSNFEAF